MPLSSGTLALRNSMLAVTAVSPLLVKRPNDSTMAAARKAGEEAVDEGFEALFDQPVARRGTTHRPDRRQDGIGGPKAPRTTRSSPEHDEHQRDRVASPGDHAPGWSLPQLGVIKPAARASREKDGSREVPRPSRRRAHRVRLQPSRSDGQADAAGDAGLGPIGAPKPSARRASSSPAREPLAAAGHLHLHAELEQVCRICSSSARSSSSMGSRPRSARSNAG